MGAPTAAELEIPVQFYKGDTMDYWDEILRVLTKARTVVLHGEIEEGPSRDATKQLLYLGLISKEPVHVVLNSVGGDLYDSLLVYDTIREMVRSGIEVTVDVRGLAASMATVILQAASPARRLASKYSRILIHEISSISAGRTSEQKEQVKELEAANDMLKGILADRAGKTPEEIEKIWHKRDVWFSADEAQAFGLLDEVY
jgi:ATP-dependent Clp protease protease subunit